MQEFFRTAQKLTAYLSTSLDRLHVEFSNNVKLKNKKRHEILALAPVIHRIAMQNDCNAIIDLGSGVVILLFLSTFSYVFYERKNQFFSVLIKNLLNPTLSNLQTKSNLNTNFFRV